MYLKETDYKLLSYLYHNYNESFSKIAKAIKLSRDQVEYRINKYMKEGLIRKFCPIFNYPKLGYNVIVVLLLKFEKPKMSDSFSASLNKNKNCISYGKCYGKYDLCLNCVFKDEKELSEFISKLFENENNFITDYLLINPQYAELFPLKFFGHPERGSFFLISNEGKTETKLTKLNEIDLKILKILSNNGREKLTNIAIKTGVSVEQAFYRLKRLKSEKIILGNRIQFDMSLLGYFFTAVLINFRNFSEKNNEKIRFFVRNSKNINSLIFNLQRPNCTIQLFHKGESEIREAITKIKKLFNEESIEIDILQIGEDEGLVNPLPFI